MKKLFLLPCALMIATAWAQPAPAQAPVPAAQAAPAAEAGGTVMPPASTDGELNLLREDNARLRLEVDRLKSDAVNAPIIDRENQQLRERIITLESERGRLTHENQTLGSWRDGLKTGAAIFAIGLVIGLFLGRARRRASDWTEM